MKRPFTFPVRVRSGENPTSIQPNKLMLRQIDDLSRIVGPKRSHIIAAAIAALYADLIGGDAVGMGDQVEEFASCYGMKFAPVVELALFHLWRQYAGLDKPGVVHVALPKRLPSIAEQPAIAHTDLSVWWCCECGAYWFDGSPSVSWYAAEAGEDDDLFLGMASLPAGQEWHRDGCPVKPDRA